jgi:outer membrane protein insertion porin family
MRRTVTLLLVTFLPLVFGACKEEGTVVVHKISFSGVRSVDEARLKSALATRQSARLPWGRKYFFDKARFEADLKRIEAFYADRGFPEAHVTSFDAKLNDKQDSVDITVTIAEGEPVRVAAVNFVGFDVIPSNHLETLEKNIPVKVDKPRDRQEVAVAHDQALNELRDHGYPYAKVATDETAAGRSVTLTFTADPSVLAHFGPIEIVGNKAVGERVIRRQLTFKPGELYRRSIVQDAQRRLYAMELFQFVNIEALNPELQEPEVRTRVTIAEG